MARKREVPKTKWTAMVHQIDQIQGTQFDLAKYVIINCLPVGFVHLHHTPIFIRRTPLRTHETTMSTHKQDDVEDMGDRFSATRSPLQEAQETSCHPKHSSTASAHTSLLSR